MANECHKYPTDELCRGLGIARSTYHAWRHRPPSRRAMDDAVLLKEIERIHVETGGAYGSPRMHADLKELGFSVGKKRVERLMRAQRLRARQFRRHRAPGSRKASVLVPNLVRRQFVVDRLNAVWVGDITQVRGVRATDGRKTLTRCPQKRGNSRFHFVSSRVSSPVIIMAASRT